jgi:hypothetical protein
MYKALLGCYLFVLTNATAFGQASYKAGTIPQLNVNVKVAENWKLNTKLEARQIFREKQPEAPLNQQLKYERTDLSWVLTKKISADNTIGGGYLARLEDGQFTHRLIQQFSSVKELEVFIIAHRVVLDETFSDGSPPEFRLRYRFGGETPLSGRQIDPKEFYGKVNNEYLGLWSDKEADLEIRASLALGYNATDDNKIELGLEYRVNGFSQVVRSQQIWLTIGWFLSI